LNTSSAQDNQLAHLRTGRHDVVKLDAVRRLALTGRELRLCAADDELEVVMI
jgi:hypothetical protein